MEKQVVYYKIANLLFELIVPKGLSAQVLLPNFSLFFVQKEKETGSDIVSHIELVSGKTGIDVSEAKLLSDVSILWGDRFQFYDLGAEYLTQVQTDQTGLLCCMTCTKNFSTVRVFIPKEITDPNMVLSWFLMIVFAQVAVFHQSILIHASVVEREREAYAFLGQSGTGKSTHSCLWMENLKDFTLLNDDNPVIQIKSDGKVAVFGTPWSGKTACYRNEERILKGFVRLKQSGSNQFYPKINKEALVTVLPSCSGIRWNKDLFSNMIGVLTHIVKCVPIGELYCLPNGEAALLCYHKISNMKQAKRG